MLVGSLHDFPKLYANTLLAAEKLLSHVAKSGYFIQFILYITTQKYSNTAKRSGDIQQRTEGWNNYRQKQTMTDIDGNCTLVC